MGQLKYTPHSVVQQRLLYGKKGRELREMQPKLVVPIARHFDQSALLWNWESHRCGVL